MASIPGINVGAAIAPFDSADNQASHRAQYGQGGLRTVDTIADRNAIYSSRLEEGMRVYVKADQKTYVLQSGYSVPTTNSDWAEESVTAIALPAPGQYSPYGSVAGDGPIITSLTKFNNYIFAGNSNGYINLIDITDESNPVNLTIINTLTDEVTDLKIAGGYLLACDASGNFYVADISIPINISVYPEYFAGTGVYSFSSMAVIGSRVGLTDSLNSKFVLLDYSDPNNIYRVAELDLPTQGRAVCVQDNIFYVACSDNTIDDGVVAVSIDGSAIYSAASIPSTVLGGICANGRYVFCSEGAGSANNSLHVIDVYDVFGINEVASLDLTPYTLEGKANCFGDFVTLTSSDGNGLIISVEDPLNPVLLYNFPVTNNSAPSVREGILSGGYVLFGYGDSGTAYMDVFQLQNLHLAGISVESAEIGELNVQKNLNVNGIISTQKGVVAGAGGIQTNGQINGARYNGMISADSSNGVVVRSVFEVAGVEQPPGVITASLAGLAGSVTNGDHDYKITYLTQVGESTPIATASDPVTVTNNAVDGRINLTSIPVSNDAAVIGKRIYRRYNGTGSYYLVATIANSLVTYQDNKSNASLGQAMDTEDTSNRATFYNTQIYKRLAMNEQGAISANNLDLPKANTVSVTGTTTINGMTSTGISSGTFVILYFSSSLTLKHDTAPSAGYLKMYLAGSTDLTVNANDVVMFVKTTAAWREVSRTIA